MEQEKSMERKVDFSYNYRLMKKINPATLFYGVMIAFLKGEKTNTLKYEISMKLFERDNVCHLVEINRVSDIWINDRELDMMAYELAVLSSSVLYPLLIAVNTKGEISRIQNYPEIKKRWELKKQVVRENYTGNYLEKYLHLNDKAFQSQDTLLNCLKNDWFLSTFFNPLYCSYTPQLSFLNRVNFPFIFDGKPVAYEIEQKIQEQISPQGYLTIDMKGKIADERSKTDLQNGLNFPYYTSGGKANGNYFARYHMDAGYHTIDSYIAECSLNLNIKRKVSVVVSRLRKENEHTSGWIPEPEEKKEGFWTKLKDIFS